MGRVHDLPESEWNEEQRRIAGEIAGARGGVLRGPFAIWLRQPHIADTANHFGNALRLQGKFDRRLFELAVLVVARGWKAQYEWYAHEEAALAAGLERDTIEAIRAGQRPAFKRDDEALVYRAAHELTEQRDLSEATYQELIAMFGLDLTIELITSIGFYTLVAVVLKGFDAPVPGNAVPIPS